MDNTIIDSQFYIIDSLSLDVLFAWNANLVVAWLYVSLSMLRWNNNVYCTVLNGILISVLLT